MAAAGRSPEPAGGAQLVVGAVLVAAALVGAVEMAAAWVPSDIGRALVGGGIIGLSAVFLMAMTGRIAGFSSILYNASILKAGDWTWRWAFLLGTATAGAALQASGRFSAAFVPLPIAGDWAMIALSGFLVGFGTVLGSGCTSGHGVCGLSRLSLRSVVSVLTFMATGAATATVAPFLPLPAKVVLAATVAGAGIAESAYTAYLAAHPANAANPANAASSAKRNGPAMPPMLSRKAPAPAAKPASVAEQLENWRELLVALAAGAIFGVGLGVSAMTNPSVVTHFLQLDAAWNPSLMFVMGSAVPVTTVGYYLAFMRSAPVCGTKFHLPTEKKITTSLVTGAVLFGVGWGLSGICPGPSVATLLLGGFDYHMWFLAMVGGMWAYYGVGLAASHLGSNAPQLSPATTAAVGSILNPFASSINLLDGLPTKPAAYDQ